MALEPKPRPRAYRLDELSMTFTGSLNEKPVGAVVIEILADPYEAEAKAVMAAHDADEAAVEVAQKQGVIARTFLSWSGVFWSALGGLVSLEFWPLADTADR